MRRSSARPILWIAFCLAWSAAATDAFARRPVRLEGEVEEIQIDDFDGGHSRVIHELRTRSNARVELVLPENGPAFRTGMHVRLRGALERSSDTTAPVLTVSTDVGSIEILAEPVAAAAVAGTRKALVMAVDFAQDG